jgi:hypothetical protein
MKSRTTYLLSAIVILLLISVLALLSLISIRWLSLLSIGLIICLSFPLGVLGAYVLPGRDAIAVSRASPSQVLHRVWSSPSRRSILFALLVVACVAAYRFATAVVSG